MDLEKSTRQPYVRPVDSTWWTKKGFYTAYMLREGTCLLVLAFVLEMLGFYIAALTGANGLWKFASFLGHPVMIAFNALVLVAVLYHAFTWFPLMPKALRVIVKDTKSGLYKLLDGKYLVILLFAALLGVTVGGIVLFYYPELLGRLLSPFGLVKSIVESQDPSSMPNGDTMNDVSKLVKDYIGK